MESRCMALEWNHSAYNRHDISQPGSITHSIRAHYEAHSMRDRHNSGSHKEAMAPRAHKLAGHGRHQHRRTLGCTVHSNTVSTRQSTHPTDHTQPNRTQCAEPQGSLTSRERHRPNSCITPYSQAGSHPTSPPPRIGIVLALYEQPPNPPPPPHVHPRSGR